METLFVFLTVLLKISLRIGNLQMLLETELLKKKTKQTNNKNKTKQNQKNQNQKINQNCIKSGRSQFLFLQQKM